MLSRWFAFGVTLLIAASARATEQAPFKLPDRSQYDFGRAVYERNCVLCHGAHGDGAGEMSPQLSPRPRSFVQGLYKYRSTPWGKLPTDADLKRTIRGGINSTAMGAYTQLHEAEVTAIVEYIKFFSRRWRRAENYAAPVELPAEPAWLNDAARRQPHAANGKLLYQAACSACHGADGDGKGPAAGGLKDDWGFPSLPADLRQQHLRSGSHLRDVYRTLATGLNGTPMISFSELLTAEQLWDLVAYIATLRPAEVSK